MLLSQSDWNNYGLNEDIQRESDSKIPGFADHVANMNKTNMNFGAKNKYFNNHESNMNIEEEDGSSTNTNNRKIKRFESSRFTADMFDPEHGP